MTEVRAPHPYSTEKPIVFLAGSIEMGSARPWQQEAVAALSGVDATVLNPRRIDWDASWEQHADHPAFREQVAWELDGLERADVVLFYFDPETKSPVSLMELGLVHARRVVVACPEGYWRKGNVDMVCERYGIPRFERLEDALAEVKTVLRAVRP